MSLPRRLWRAYAPPVLVIGLYYLAARLVLDRLDVPMTFDIAGFLPELAVSLPIFVLGGAFGGFFYLVATRTAERPFARIWRGIRGTNWAEVLLARLVPAFLIFFVMQRVYIAFKVAIPDIAPFAWDPAFAGWDRALFLGRDGWELTHGLFGGLLPTAILDEIYITWFFVLFGSFFAVAVMRLESPARLAFLTAFPLTWAIGGSLLAVIFSSAGPAFYEGVTGDSAFRPLMDRLAALSGARELHAPRIIDKLWLGYIDPAAPRLGISAFPSMHLAVSALIACLAFSANRWLGWAAALFTAAMQVGSVHLAWHYAVDGIAGIALAVLIWWLSLAFARRWLGQGS